MRLIAAALLFLLMIGSSIAQPAKPNLTGTWKVNLSKSKLAPQHPPYRDDVYQIKHSGSKLEMRHMFSEGTETYWYTIDGKERQVFPMPNRSISEVLRAKAYWDGHVLVIEKQQESPFGVSIWKSRYTLSEDGKSLAITYHSAKSPLGALVDELLTYEKQP